MKSAFWVNGFVILVVAAAMLPAAAPVQAQAQQALLGAYVPGELVVGLAEDVPLGEAFARAQALAESAGGTLVRQDQRLALLSFAENADVLALASQLALQPDVIFAEPNSIYALAGTPAEAVLVTERTFKTGADTSQTISLSDLRKLRSIRTVSGVVTSIPTFPSDAANNWGYLRISADLVWPSTKASPWVCVLDSGVDSSQPDLSGKVVQGYDYVNDDTIPNDDNGHGTFIAGIIAAKINNGIGISGISNGKVYAVKVTDWNGMGTEYDLTLGIKACANRTEVRVINISAVSYNNSIAVYNALVYAANTKSKLIVAASGDEGSSTPAFPAAWAYPDYYPWFLTSNTIHTRVISVAASVFNNTWVDSYDPGVVNGDEMLENCIAPFSNYGNWVEIAAPGESIYSTLPTSYPSYLHEIENMQVPYDYMSSTSVAAAHVSGAAARVISVYSTLPNLVAERILSTGYYLNAAQRIERGSSDAPYCWPVSMSDYTFLNVARAMKRGALLVGAVSANSAFPATGAYLRAVWPNASVLDTSLVTGIMGRYAILLNLPATIYKNDTPDPYTLTNLQVLKSGIANSYTTYYKGVIITADMLGEYEAGYVVGLPTSVKNIYLVAKWNEGYPLDMQVWLPKLTPLPAGSTPLPGNTYGGNGYFNASFTDGELYKYPYIRGYGNGASPSNPYPMEYIQIAKRSSGTQYPYYYDKGYYTVLMRPDTTREGNNSSITDGSPILTIWSSGAVKKIIEFGKQKSPSCPNPDLTDAAWKAATSTATSWTVWNTCQVFTSPYLP